MISNISRYFCSDDISLIENYSKAVSDENETWDCHHRAEILPCGRFSRKDLKTFGLYWRRPASELIFLKHGEHKGLHNIGNGYFLGKRHTSETRRIMSLSHTGRLHTEEECRKISESHMGWRNPNFGKKASEETRKKLSEAHKGLKFWNDGKRNVRATVCPEGFVPGRIKVAS